MMTQEPNFPHYVILKASAGSGKTMALTKRYVYFLLSDKVPYSELKNILAITFSNNAAYEMKSRILGWLKDLYFKKQEAVQEFSKILSISEKDLASLAEKALENILNNYSDFQVKTIDSFMTAIFKNSALDFDYNPDFEILMNNEYLMNYAYDLFLKDIEEKSPKARVFEETIEKISKYKDSFLWDPSEEVFRKIKDLYSITSSINKEFIVFDVENEQKRIEKKLIELMEQIKYEVVSSRLERNLKNQIFNSFESIIQTKNFTELLQKSITTPPTKKPKNKQLIEKYEKIDFLWQEFLEAVADYAYLYARAFYLPYLKILEDFQQKLSEVKHKECTIFIEDINKMLSQYLDKLIIPDIYFRLGEKIHHFLIDEFQDTSPLQWANLKPLIENALSEKGSLFVVGDTKQAIYSFRGADYRIMKELEREVVFPSANKIIEELNINYRSKGRILEFIESVFKNTTTIHPNYVISSTLTGLDCCKQILNEGAKDKGYVETKDFYSENEDEEKNIKEYISKTIEDICKRGYRLKDIAILAFKNEQVVNISSWLNDLNLPFISYSSLDVRRRKVTSEVLSLLKFLDSPIDDFAFSVFILGDIFKKFLNKIKRSEIVQDIHEFLLKNRKNSPLYKYFKKEFHLLWEEYFQKLFKLTGYLSIYDLLSAALSNFKVFETMPDEEATFLKILELVKTFEGKGLSSIKDFIEFFSTSDDEKMWDITLGTDIDAIQVMTVHKAKGLGFPIVILFFEDSRDRADEYILQEIEENICIIKINNNLANKCNTLQKIKNTEKISRIADSLNTLYVAFTRAEEELYIICKIKKDRSFPFDILENFLNKTFGEKTLKDSLFSHKAQIIEFEHHPLNIEFSLSGEEIHLREKQRGDFIHRVLALINYSHEELIKELEFKIEKLNRELKKSFDASEIKEIILSMLEHPQMKEFFIEKPGRIFLNEFEISDSEGFIHRIDRIVIDIDSITVIEYKTGNPASEHSKQIELYLKLLSKIYKDYHVHGCLYYLDSQEVKWL